MTDIRKKPASRFYVYRTKEFEGTVYEVLQEGGFKEASVEMQFLHLHSSWRLKFRSSGSVVLTEAMFLNQAIQTAFFTEEGAVLGYVSEARFSAAGKSVVYNQTREIIGYVVSKLVKTEFLSASGGLMGTARPHRWNQLPTFVFLRDQNRLWRFVVEQTAGTALDRRLLWCLICRLVWSEQNST